MTAQDLNDAITGVAVMWLGILLNFVVACIVIGNKIDRGVHEICRRLDEKSWK